MRILQLKDTYDSANPSRDEIIMARALAQRGHSVTVLTSMCNGSFRLVDNRISRSFDASALPGVRVVRRPGFKLPFLRTVAFLPAMMIDGKYDVVHAHNLGSFANMLAAAQRPRCRAIVLKSDLSERTFVKLRRRSFKSSLFAFFLEHCDRVQCLSEFERERLIELGVDGGRIVVVPPALDLTRYHHEPPAENIVRLGYFGSIEPVKGLADIAPTLDEFVSTSQNVEVRIAGPVSDSRYARVALARMAVSGRARYYGPVAPADEFLKDIDVLLAPSRSETGAISVLEAMASGASVLAKRNPLHCEYIQDGVNGYIYDDIPEFKAKCESLIEDGQLRRRLAMNAQEFAKRFDIQKVVERLESLYLEVASNKMTTVPPWG